VGGGANGGLRSDADKAAAAKRYAFLYDEVLPQEAAQLKAAAKVRHWVCDCACARS
jgi:hypothetical protein